MRSPDKMLAGACGGIADYTGMDVSLIRVLTVLMVLSTGVIMGLLVYLAATVVMPDADYARPSADRITVFSS